MRRPLLLRVGAAALIVLCALAWWRPPLSPRPLSPRPLSPRPPWNSAGAIAALQAVVDCWAHDGDWAAALDAAAVREDACLLAQPDCYGLATRDRVNEIGYRWTVPPTCNAAAAAASAGRDYVFRPAAELAPALNALVNRTTVLVTGDSFHRKLFHALKEQVECITRGRLSRNMFFAGAYRLETVEILNVPTPQVDLARELAQRAYDVYVINKGAHYSPLEDFLATYNRSIDDLLRRSPNALLLVRSTPIGHAGCEAFRNRPPLTAAESDALLAETVKTIGRQYHWADVLAQNSALRAFLATKCPDRCIFLDVTPATMRRADSHYMYPTGNNRTDCFHYCSPGPMDMWIDMILNTLFLVHHAYSL